MLLENFKYFADRGVALTNYYATTHPSEPNYFSSIAGDYFGMEDDDVYNAPEEVFTVVDLLESKNISWAHYEEDMPSAGFTGASYVNQVNGQSDYVRKHNPAVSFKSVSGNKERLARLKTLNRNDETKSDFHKDLKANKLPQWMFITPNMTSDGHNSDVATAGRWTRDFLKPLLSDKNFMQNTLVLITWDESEIYTIRNQILGILIGDAVPTELVGTEDKGFYNHYSEIASVSANWDLPTLGRWDVGANVYNLVASKTGDKLREWKCDSEFQKYYWNAPYGGQYNENNDKKLVIPKPNLDLDESYSGRRILPAIKAKFAHSKLPTYYQDTIKVYDPTHPPPGYPSPPEDE